MLDVRHQSRRRAYSDFGLYDKKDSGRSSTESCANSDVETVEVEVRRNFLGIPKLTSAILETRRNRDSHGAKKEARATLAEVRRSSSPTPATSGSPSPESCPASSKVTGCLAAQAFHLMVTIPQDGSPEQESGGTNGRASDLPTPRIYENGVSFYLDSADQPGTAKSAPSTPQTEQRAVPRPLPRHDTFIAPGLLPATPAAPTPPQSRASTSPVNPKPMKIKTTSFSKTNRNAIKTLSRSTPAMSPSGSPRHSDTEAIPVVATKGTKKFFRHFPQAPQTEFVIEHYACALVSDILLQGTLYLTPNFFAFYSKIFGYVSSLLIPLKDVTNIQKERTAKIFPNAVGITTVDGKSYVFSSLLSRDTTYKRMVNLWTDYEIYDEAVPQQPDEIEEADSASGSCSAESLEDEKKKTGDCPPLPSGEPPGSVSIVKSSLEIAAEKDTPFVSGSPSRATPTATATTLPAVEIVPEDATESAPTEAVSPQNEASPPPGSWIASLAETSLSTATRPFRLLNRSAKELWTLPRNSLLLGFSTFLLALLFLSAAIMLHRVESLSKQLGSDGALEYQGLHEEVLQMQQRLHAAATSEVEKTLSIQLKQIATVRQSLEALMRLFSKENTQETDSLDAKT